jgi:peptide/nickel transport system substrate-binding protein
LIRPSRVATLGAVAGRRAERFLTTVLFTDIVGSTELAAELGDRGWRDLVQEHHRLVRAALRRHGGREIDTAGDSFFAVFDAPAAGVECALEIGPAVEPLGLQVRAGLHVGEVEQIAGKVGGITVPIASRIMSAAGAGEVLVSQTVRDLSAGSGLHFEDRGSRELKGVPGEWHLFAVTRPAAAVAGADAAITEEDRTTRRAAAVRRARSRPIWQRNPRLTALAAIGLAVIVVAAGLFVWQPWLPPALTNVDENAVGVIDAGRNVIVGQAAVGSQPGAIAFGEGSVWVANTGDDTVSQLDPKTHAVVDTIDVGKTPTGIAVGEGSIWVADSGERAVTRINAATRRVVETVTVGNGPRAIALGSGAVWVANAGDGTVTRIDAATGEAAEPVGLASLPTAVAADDGGAWVVSEDSGTVTHLDPTTAAPVAAPIAVGTRPSAIAIGDGAVWVANTGDGSISKIDPTGHRVTGLIDIGGSPVGLAIGGTSLWFADAAGAIGRVDTSALSAAPRRLATGAVPQALAIVDGAPWFVSRAATTSHRGGTLRILSNSPTTLDPANLPFPEFSALVGDGLVGYRRVGGVAGTQLVPDLATSIPTPTDGGRTYTFQLRGGLVYSDGTPIKPSDFLFALERVFQVTDPDFENAGAAYFPELLGADACADAPVPKCDLSRAIVADDARNSIVFHLSEPDGDFLYKLATPFAQPVPPRAAAPNALITGPFPVPGPYALASATGTDLRFVRNPHFQPRADVRPDGYPDEIIWTSGVEATDQIAKIEAGDADYGVDQIPPESFPTLQTRFTPQLHIARQSTTYAFMNAKLPPFDNMDVRRAVSYAVDRAHVVDLRGGTVAAGPTCQVLPPNFPAYEPYCPYTENAGPGRGWTAPDLTMARKLVAGSGTAGMKVVVGPFSPRLTAIAQYVESVLKDLGYQTSLSVEENGRDVFKAIFFEKRVQIGGFEFDADFPAADTFLGQFACDRDDDPTFACDEQLDATIKAAEQLEGSDPAAANQKWAEADRRVTDLALWAPLLNEGSDFVSARVGNYQFNVAVGFLADQAWVK